MPPATRRAISLAFDDPCERPYTRNLTPPSLPRPTSSNFHPNVPALNWRLSDATALHAFETLYRRIGAFHQRHRENDRRVFFRSDADPRRHPRLDLSFRRPLSLHTSVSHRTQSFRHLVARNIPTSALSPSPTAFRLATCSSPLRRSLSFSLRPTSSTHQARSAV